MSVRIVTAPELSWLDHFEIRDGTVATDWRHPATWARAVLELVIPGTAAAGRRRRQVEVSAILTDGVEVQLGVVSDEQSADMLVTRARRGATAATADEFRAQFAQPT